MSQRSASPSEAAEAGHIRVTRILNRSKVTKVMSKWGTSDTAKFIRDHNERMGMAGHTLPAELADKNPFSQEEGSSHSGYSKWLEDGDRATSERDTRTKAMLQAFDDTAFEVLGLRADHMASDPDAYREYTDEMMERLGQDPYDFLAEHQNPQAISEQAVTDDQTVQPDVTTDVETTQG